MEGAGNLPVRVMLDSEVYNLWSFECVYAVSWRSVPQLLVVLLWANILRYFHIELNLLLHSKKENAYQSGRLQVPCVSDAIW